MPAVSSSLITPALDHLTGLSADNIAAASRHHHARDATRAMTALGLTPA